MVGHRVINSTGDQLTLSSPWPSYLACCPMCHFVKPRSLPQEGVLILCELSRSHLTCISGKRHWFTARISASDGRQLPLKTPNELLEMYSTYPDLKGIRLNACTKTVKIWWVSFRSQEALESSAREVDGSVQDDVTLHVTIDFKPPPSPSQTKPGRFW
jgi:hypothetical protein